jgi:hypothetical protein
VGGRHREPAFLGADKVIQATIGVNPELANGAAVIVA